MLENKRDQRQEACGVIDGVTNADAIPVLERMLQFAGARHRLLVHNIANMDTPGFRPADVSVDGFRKALGESIDVRRERWRPLGNPLPPPGTSDVEVVGGRLRLHPKPVGENILFHDRNDRDVERTMQSLVENFLTFRLMAELLLSRFALINSAIRERI